LLYELKLYWVAYIRVFWTLQIPAPSPLPRYQQNFTTNLNESEYQQQQQEQISAFLVEEPRFRSWQQRALIIGPLIFINFTVDRDDIYDVAPGNISTHKSFPLAITIQHPAYKKVCQFLSSNFKKGSIEETYKTHLARKCLPKKTSFWLLSASVPQW